MTDHRTTVASYAASGCAVIAGLTANEFAALIGAGCAIATLGMNFWFKQQQLRLAREMAARGQHAGENDG